MSKHSWLAGRAALAIVLMVSFYVLALAVAGGLLWVAYADVAFTRHPAIRLVMFCVVGALSVLWAIVPRPDRFDVPGPRLTAEEQPELFALIRGVAAKTSQAMPEDVYLTNDVNAFVAQRGGIMGVGARRVMGLGLPLMQSLTVDEFKGVLAHEFGHYHAGDVALGPWIYKTRAAIGRTIAQLSDNVLRFIFIAYANLFLRVTHAVSRRQEFIADEVGASVAGAAAMASGLRKVGAAAVLYQSYWHNELLPVVQAGFRPPVTWGFARYSADPKVSPLFEAVAQDQESAEQNPYDTHPPLKDRVAALSRQASAAGVADIRPAASLLRDIDACERRLFEKISADFASLKALDWAHVCDAVYTPMWRARVKKYGALLRDYTCLNPPASRAELITIGRGIIPSVVPDEVRIGAAWQLIVAAYSLTLAPLGWTAETWPGDEVVLRRGSDELRPWSELSAVVDGHTPIAAWRERCVRLGMGELRLGTEPELVKG